MRQHIHTHTHTGRTWDFLLCTILDMVFKVLPNSLPNLNSKMMDAAGRKRGVSIEHHTKHQDEISVEILKKVVKSFQIEERYNHFKNRLNSQLKSGKPLTAAVGHSLGFDNWDWKHHRPGPKKLLQIKSTNGRRRHSRAVGVYIYIYIIIHYYLFFILYFIFLLL